MKEHIYEPLTTEENLRVNSKLKTYHEAVVNNVLTRKEADYSFQEWATENFERQYAFLICTNREDFG